MKKLIYMRAAFIAVCTVVSTLFLLACPSSGGGGTPGSGNTSEPPPPEPPAEIQYGKVVFNNKDSTCPVRVYNSAAERNEAGECIVEVPPAARSEEKQYQATEYGFTFYFSYIIYIDDVPLPYIPQQPDGIQTIGIDSGKTTTVDIPPINEVVQSVAPLTGSVYIKIKNDSAFSLSLVKGVNVMKPEKPENYELADSVLSYIVNGGVTAIYKLNFYENETENTQIYKLNIINGSTLDLHTIVPVFEAGHIYTIVVNDQNLAALAPELDSQKPITLNEASVAPGVNDVFSYTKWRGYTVDAETGEYVLDDCTIEFYGNSARLNGRHLKQADGSAYSGQILESEYASDLEAMIIWTKKSAARGFLLEKQPDGALHITPSTTRHPFYKQ